RMFSSRGKQCRKYAVDGVGSKASLEFRIIARHKHMDGINYRRTAFTVRQIFRKIRFFPAGYVFSVSAICSDILTLKQQQSAGHLESIIHFVRETRVFPIPSDPQNDI